LGEIPRDAARSGAKPCIVASMATKKTAATTKAKTPASPKRAKPDTEALDERRKLDDEIRQLEEIQAGRAVERAFRWAQLVNHLELLLDRAHDLFTYGVPVDFETVEWAHALEMERDPGIRLGDVREKMALSLTCYLTHELQRAENWLPMIGVEYENGHSRALADVRLRLEGEAPLDATATPAEALALAITYVRKLLEVDLARAKLGAGSRPPVGVEIKVLRMLLSSKTALDGDAVAKKIGGNRQTVSAKTVWDAVNRLRRECGYEIPKTGAGYKLTDGDRELARNHGVVVEVVEDES
jgi:biotin operon repressor